MNRSAEDDAGQPLVQHLSELRDRLMRCVLLVLAFALALMAFANDLYTFISQPLRTLLPEGTSMIATEVASTFLAPFKLVMVASLCLAMPFILQQLWGFVAPGMYKREKRVALPLLTSSIILFYAGLAFAYYAVFPLVFGFFSSIVPDGVAYTPDISRFLDIALKLFMAFGLAFEIPIATMLLIWSGAVERKSLQGKRPYVIVGCFVFAMLLTPPDVFSQCLLALPMWLLFEAGLFFSRFLGLREEPAADSD
ncbi:MAG: sec-independent protein translocase protein TatC [Bacteroidia bacterium]|jgi:sec-independent protein translocase protein TatC